MNTDYNRSTSRETHHSSVRGRGRGQVRECWADSPGESPSSHIPSWTNKDEQHGHTSTRYIGRGRTRGRREDNTGNIGDQPSKTSDSREDTKGGAGIDHSDRIQDQTAVWSFETQCSRDTATGDHHQSSSDILNQSSGQCGRVAERQHRSGTQEEGRNSENWKSRDPDHCVEDKHKGEQQKTEEYETPGHNCQYCGDIVNKKEVIRQGKEVYHNKCLRVHLPYCQEAVAAFRGISRKKHVLYMAVPVSQIFGSKEIDKNKKTKREFRDIKISELLNKVTALRNSNSGFLLVHLIGLDPEDKFTGAFDEFADVKLKGLINDGSLFDDVYKKSRLSDHRKQDLRKFTNILVLYVEKDNFLTTSDFKTKEALDDCVVDIPDQTLLTFIKNRRVTEEKFHEIPAQNAEDLCHLFESRQIQTKVVWEPNPSDDKLVLNVFNKLRPAEYISAFTKNRDGGSYLLGLAEETTEIRGYRSKLLKVTPVVIDDCDVVRKLIRDRVSASCCVGDYLGNEQRSDDLVKTLFIPSRDNTGYVIHMSVRSVNGIVFYDKYGPVAYRVDTVNRDENSITRLTLAEWFTAFRRRLQ